MHGKIERRVNKDGSISFSTRIEGPRDPDSGERRRVRVTAGTERELRKAVAAALADIRDGTRVKADDRKVGEFVGWWLDNVMASELRPTTLAAYREVLARYIDPHIGAVRLQALTPARVQEWERALLTAGGKRRAELAPGTVRRAHGVLRAALNAAVRFGFLGRNPVSAVRAPREPRAAPPVWTPEEARRFLDVARWHHLEPFWTLAVLTGMRRGELLGLRWSDLDLAAGEARVTVTRVRAAKGRVVESSPKTAAGRRVVALPDEAREVLASVRRQRIAAGLAEGRGFDPAERVVVTRSGTPPAPGLFRGTLRMLCRKAGVPEVRVHDLRHIHASLLLQLGVHPKVVQERLGHASVGITLDVYSHVIPAMHRDAVRSLGSALGPKDGDEEAAVGHGD